MSQKRKKPGPDKISPYTEEIEQYIRDTYEQLSEKERRKYAAVEALKIPEGGQSYIARVVGCSRNTIRRGIAELKNSEKESEESEGRIRRKGAGRKPAIEIIENIDEVFIGVIEDYTAGDPMNANIRWTNLSLEKIAERMADAGIRISVTVVRKLLGKHGFVKRKALKNKRIGSSKNRNEQFEKIARLKKEYSEEGNPIVSIDTKKKEFIGNLDRGGTTYCDGVIEVYDHDFPYLADGVVIPHTIYDLNRNEACVNIGISKDTSEFACDSLQLWWEKYAFFQYPNATSILMLADSGGSNSCRHYIFKEDLQKLVDKIGVEIRIAHYPPYTSKWNPVEHRVFPHITRSLKGAILGGYHFVKELIENTATKTGLTVKANIIKKIYKTGRKYAENFKEEMEIVFDDFLGSWNYRAVPATMIN